MKQRLCTTFLSAALAFCGCASISIEGWSLEKCREIDLPSVAKSAGGIAWDGADCAYVATDDRPALLCRLKLKFDSDGVLESAEGKVLGIPEAASDSEAAAVDPLDGGIWVAHEISNRVIKYRKDDPALAVSRELKMPPVLRKARKGRGLESLAISADGLALFTCTEEALACDGNRATRENGTYVRLMRFVRDGVDSPWRPDGQWAYLTEPISGGAWNTKSGDASRNGVSELCIAKDGTLLLLERDFSCTVMPNFDCRVYAVDFSGATDVTSLASLEDAAQFKPVSKRRVLRLSGFTMYEGMCRGPDLKDGSETFFLCSDGGRGTPARILHVKKPNL
ncbi:MAG: esterase-like activity of phytase family protein [Kiritimatiellae bacterium]|nr:esterase-like activity of phytase family protein [Kiritimatiellia bacterium]